MLLNFFNIERYIIGLPSTNDTNKKENNNENEKHEYAHKAEISGFPNMYNVCNLIILLECFSNIL